MPAENETEFHIRQAESDDAIAMAELDRVCFETPWSLKEFEKEVDTNPLAVYLVVEKDSDIIAYAGLWCVEDEGHITNVAVHPDYRKQGTGYVLVNTLLNIVRTYEGVTKFTLEVRVSNIAAIKLYKKFGFEEAGIRKGYYSKEKEDAVIMWLYDSE